MATTHPAPVPEVGDAEEDVVGPGGSGVVDTNASHVEKGDGEQKEIIFELPESESR